MNPLAIPHLHVCVDVEDIIEVTDVTPPFKTVDDAVEIYGQLYKFAVSEDITPAMFLIPRSPVISFIAKLFEHDLN